MFQSRRPHDRELGRLFDRPTVNGVAVILGSVSGGLACRDFDTVDGYRKWASSHECLATALPTVQTGRGYHVYFRTQYESYANLRDGELRDASKFYCLIPPSPHPSEIVYRWMNGFPSGPSDFPLLDVADAGFSARNSRGAPVSKIAIKKRKRRLPRGLPAQPKRAKRL